MSLFSKLFGQKPKTAAKSPAEIYAGLRNMILTKRPPDFHGFWGVVLDMGMPNGTATMIAVADGTVSLYTSTGGGIIGLGPHEGPKKSASELLQFAPKFVQHCQRTLVYPLPSSGNTRFYLMSSDTTVSDEVRSEELGKGSHVLSPLFIKCHELLTEMRKVDEKLRSDSAGSAKVQ